MMGTVRILIQTIWRKISGLLMPLLLCVCSIVVVLLSAEISLTWVLNHPEACRGRVRSILRQYYHHHDCDIFQMDKGRTHYDSSLFYSMNPGRFRFKNREFNTLFEVNSAGFRDDESSLDQPTIVVLGDSYAMGWGVENDETFASLIERDLGLKVLNTAVSSYGTAREVASLARVNTERMQYLIIQYCPNDHDENQHFVLHDNTLVVGGEGDYDRACASLERRISYYPFKHSTMILRQFVRNLMGKAKPAVHSPSEIGADEAFLEIVGGSDAIPRHARIIVFTLEAERADGEFVGLLRDRLNRNFGSSLHDRMSFVDLSGLIEDRHRFILDPHLNRAGHRVIADQLIDHILHLERTTGPKEWFYPGGATAIRCDYVDGLKDGLLTAFWPDGKVSRTTWFKRGSKDGLETEFDRNGVKTVERHYRVGRLNGWLTRFGPQGRPIEPILYDDGEVAVPAESLNEVGGR